MCYDTSIPEQKDLISQFKKKKVKYVRDQYYHVSGFVRPFLPVTLNNNIDVIDEARWKLIPFWVKTEEAAKKYANTLNAESETVFEKASYKPYILKNRGLLYVNGFYEPHVVPGLKATENYYIYKPNKEIFTLGIVYAPFTDQETGETYNSFSILTTKANPLLEEVHNAKKRMPFVVPEYNREAWLNSTSKEEIQSLMKPYEFELSTHRVMRVTAARGIDLNTPEVQNAI
jgi:putative SOS response-associated peptidase YedK